MTAAVKSHLLHPQFINHSSLFFNNKLFRTCNTPEKLPPNTSLNTKYIYFVFLYSSSLPFALVCMYINSHLNRYACECNSFMDNLVLRLEAVWAGDGLLRFDNGVGVVLPSFVHMYNVLFFTKNTLSALLNCYYIIIIRTLMEYLNFKMKIKNLCVNLKHNCVIPYAIMNLSGFNGQCSCRQWIFHWVFESERAKKHTYKIKWMALTQSYALGSNTKIISTNMAHYHVGLVLNEKITDQIFIR